MKKEEKNKHKWETEEFDNWLKNKAIPVVLIFVSLLVFIVILSIFKDFFGGPFYSTWLLLSLIFLGISLFLTGINALNPRDKLKFFISLSSLMAVLALDFYFILPDINNIFAKIEWLRILAIIILSFYFLFRIVKLFYFKNKEK
ncbi:MAG: hypothetical protein NTZ83_00220 [Candidatus Pacearchaeota archaeon]|nr:hypothetical protein [Candidatus Pacearchaeota archaeon]